MPYTPQVGAAALHLAGAYTPPVGAAALHLGASSALDRTGSIRARSTSTAAVRAVGRGIRITARSGASRGIVRGIWDANLLSGVVAGLGSSWHQGPSAASGLVVRTMDSERSFGSATMRVTEGPGLRDHAQLGWDSAPGASGSGVGEWSEAIPVRSVASTAWRGSPSAGATGRTDWTGARPGLSGGRSSWRQLESERAWMSPGWVGATRVEGDRRLNWSDGEPGRHPFVTAWNQAGYPGHWLRIPIPVPIPVNPRIARLCIYRPLDGARLTLGLRCPTLDRRYYLVLNTARLVRLPDRVELPCTSMTISADCDSWVWSLSASLDGGADLVDPLAPAYLPREVEATVNGYTWQFLLDEPKRSRSFPTDTIQLSGRSRAAWIGPGFGTITTGVNANPLTANQAAERAVENSGWSVDWKAMPDWLIPAGLLRWDGTPIDRLIQLVKPVDGCLLADRADSSIRAYPRYPRPPWEWTPAKLPQNWNLAESAVESLSREDDRRPLVNGVYVGGTVAGVMASARISGTDGAMQAEMVSDVLICDGSGVAARARAISVLSRSGPGWTYTADTLLQPAGEVTSVTPPGSVGPGDVVNLAGALMLTRGVSIRAERGPGGQLGVRQTLRLERREVEA